MLENTLYKLTHDKKLIVGYFGGSITEGAGASDAGKTCWRALTGAWMRGTFPEAEITAVNAAIGGTGSGLGIFRIEKDLLRAKPDLVFIEFSVNDGGAAYEETLANSETLVRKIWAANPCADIIYIHTMTKDIADTLSAGGEYRSRTAHSTVMHYYGIPQIDVGEILRTRILSEGGGWAVYTTDNVHPRDNGYAIYGDAVTAYLSEQLTKPSDGDLTAPTPRSLPAPLIAQSRENAHLEDAAAYASDGWTVVEQSLCGRYPRYIEADKPGTALTFRFSGKRVGLYMMRAKDSGDIRYAIDGGEEQALSTWDHYCKQFNRAASVLLCGELPQGEHTVTITVSGTKAEESEGTAIRIGAFMVY